MELCPCGSEQAFDQCCEPIINGEKTAQTAEALMRSRYTAYARTNVQYIVDTTHPELRKELDDESIRSWSETSEWHGLEIVDTIEGGPEDDAGKVEFIAHFCENGEKKTHHELGHFVKDDDVWYFTDGEPVKPKQYIRSTPKIGRNEPCPCGSGKKYKKCCGK